MSFHPGETILAVMEELQNIMENQEIILKNGTKSYHKCFDAFIEIIFLNHLRIYFCSLFQQEKFSSQTLPYLGKFYRES